MISLSLPKACGTFPLSCVTNPQNSVVGPQRMAYEEQADKMKCSYKCCVCLVKKKQPTNQTKKTNHFQMSVLFATSSHALTCWKAVKMKIC